jgi:hypothetical protein
MTTIAERPVVFHDWTKWARRRSIQSNPAEGGVYLLAHSSSMTAPERATLECLPFEVVYVGIAKNLNARPLNGNHAGMKKYHAEIDATVERLFVAFAPLFETGGVDYAAQRFYAQHVEALLVWNQPQRPVACGGRGVDWCVAAQQAKQELAGQFDQT